MLPVEPIRVGLAVRWPTGGIRTHLKYLYANLPAGKYRPVLIAPKGLETDFLLENLSPWKPETRLVDESSEVAFGRAVIGAIRNDRLNLVHSHGFTSAALTGVPARAFGIPHVATIHDVMTKVLAARLGWVGRKALGAMLQQATIVHAVGDDAAANLTDQLLTIQYAQERIRVIRNGVHIPQFSGVVPRDLRSELGLAQDVFVLGFLGRFMAQKGFRTLIDMAGLLRDIGAPRPIKILAVGDGGFVREDRAEVTRRGLDSFFAFQGTVEDPASTLAALDCLAMPSLWEAFSILAAEALCLGVPLIASNCIGLREVVADTPATVFEAGSAEALAVAVRKEMIEPSGARARDFVPEARRRFDVRQAAVQIDRLFEELLTKHGRRKH